MERNLVRRKICKFTKTKLQWVTVSTYAVDKVSVRAGRDVESLGGVVHVNFKVRDVALQLTPERCTTPSLVNQSVCWIIHTHTHAYISPIQWWIQIRTKGIHPPPSYNSILAHEIHRQSLAYLNYLLLIMAVSIITPANEALFYCTMFGKLLQQEAIFGAQKLLIVLPQVPWLNLRGCFASGKDR